MRAIVITEHGGPEVFAIQELPDPIPGAGDVLIRVKAFRPQPRGHLHASGVWSFGIPVLGIEAAGIVEADQPSGRGDRARTRGDVDCGPRGGQHRRH